MTLLYPAAGGMGRRTCDLQFAAVVGDSPLLPAHAPRELLLPAATAAFPTHVGDLALALLITQAA